MQNQNEENATLNTQRPTLSAKAGIRTRARCRGHLAGGSIFQETYPNDGACMYTSAMNSEVAIFTAVRMEAGAIERAWRGRG